MENHIRAALTGSLPLQLRALRFLLGPRSASIGTAIVRLSGLISGRRHHQTIMFAYQSKGPSTQAEHERLFRFERYRWLWDEEKQLRDRYRPFNVEELKRVAVQATGASKCVSLTKLNEGSYNRAIRLVMDNDAVAIARLPNPNVESPGLATASEGTTTDFVSIPQYTASASLTDTSKVRTVLHLPVPKVTTWSSSCENPVRSEYIIMEEASGIVLAEVWDEMNIDEKDSIVEQLVELQKKLCSFDRYDLLLWLRINIPELC